MVFAGLALYLRFLKGWVATPSPLSLEEKQLI